MKIAYLGPSGVFGGVRAIAEHCNGLAARGHAVTFISTDGQPISWLPMFCEQRPLGDPGAGYDVVVGTAINTWPIAQKIAGEARTVGFLQMAEWLFAPKDSDPYRALMRDFATPIDVMAISGWLAELAETVPGRKVYPIRNGIDTRLFYPEPFADVPQDGAIRVVLEGLTPNPAKDVDDMAARAVRRLRWDGGYKIVTGGFSQFNVQLFEYDQFWHNPPQHVIRKIYSSGDIFLKATRYEGRPGPDMEAMACGAVVCRAIGTGDDDLINDVNCLKVGYGDFDGFLENFRRLCDDADLRKRLRDGGLEYAKSHPWEGAIDLVEEALTGAVSQPRGNKAEYGYDLAAYNNMQQIIVEWETPQAMWLGETLDELLQPRSVIDVGCGPGVYLVPFKPHCRVLGVDGAPEAGKALEPGEFVTADFRADWRPESAFDLALCIEVGEHLPPDRADYLVDLLTTCADAVFFSAAQPGQGGTLHLNEQPKAYWLEKFRARGFDLHPHNDYLQARIAANPHCQRVQWLIGNAMLLGKHHE